MTGKWFELVTGSLDEKRRFRDARARIAALPPAHRIAAEGVTRYLLRAGLGAEDRLVTMIVDLADLFEQSAAAGTTVRGIVGDDPVGFTEEFRRNYGLGAWLTKEQRQLTDAIARAEATE